MGAWIETNLSNGNFSGLLSHPTWVRGLKPVRPIIRFTDGAVAPYVGAWIETTSAFPVMRLQTSHPTWVRGLKLF